MLVFKAIVDALHFRLFPVHLRTEPSRLMRNPLRLEDSDWTDKPEGPTALRDGDFSTHNHDLASIYLAFPLTSMNSKGHRGVPPTPHPRRRAPPLPMPQAAPSPPPTHSSTALPTPHTTSHWAALAAHLTQRKGVPATLPTPHTCPRALCSMPPHSCHQG